MSNQHSHLSQQSEKRIQPPIPVQGTPSPTGEMADLLALMARLRQDCPWDIKQTNQSLIPYAIEEAYELGEAVASDDDEDIKGELGDVLLQVVFHCQLYAEQGRFDLSDVITTLQEKLVRRHPHVFDAENLPDDEAVKKRWDEIKAEENLARERRAPLNKARPKRFLDKVKAGSALMQAQNLQKQAGKVGFDWGDGLAGVTDALAKVDEEISELKAEINHLQALDGDKAADNEPNQQSRRQRLEKELGDCFFALTNVARKLDLDAEMATLTCVQKFKSRFAYIENTLAEQGKTLEESTLAEMDALWEQAKRDE